MACAPRAVVALATLAVGVARAAEFEWAGRTTDFADPLNWDGPDGISPAGQSAATQPGLVSIGDVNGVPVTSTIAANDNVFVGGTLQFDGPGTIVLGDGTGTTTMQFDPSNNNEQIMFKPDMEFGCPANWVKSAVDSDGCPVPALRGDSWSIPRTSGHYMVEIERENPGALLNDRLMSFTDCVDGILEATRGRATVTIAFTRSGRPSQNFCNDVILNARDISVGTCPSDLTCSQEDDVAAATTARSTSDASTSDDSGGSTLIVIIVVIALVVIIGIVVAVVVILKKKGSTDNDRGTVSFENPMYDSAGDAAAAANNDNTYQEPVAGDTSGYMDVPANASASSGYMDVGTGGGTGYMDVAPTSSGTGYMDVAPGYDDATGFDDDQEDV